VRGLDAHVVVVDPVDRQSPEVIVCAHLNQFAPLGPQTLFELEVARRLYGGPDDFATSAYRRSEG